MIPKPENIAVKARLVTCPTIGAIICLGDDSAQKVEKLLKQTQKYPEHIFSREVFAYPRGEVGNGNSFFTDYLPPVGQDAIEYAYHIKKFIEQNIMVRPV